MTSKIPQATLELPFLIRFVFQNIKVTYYMVIIEVEQFVFWMMAFDARNFL